MYIKVKSLLDEKESIRGISRILKIDRKTVRKIRDKIDKNGGVLKCDYSYNRSSKLDKYKEEITSLVKKGLSAKRIYEDICETKKVKISYSAINRYVSKIKKSLGSEYFFVLHSQAGEEMQVDFGYVGMIEGKKAWVFVATLSYSRYMYATIVYSQSVPNFIKSHIKAFEYFGGVPKKVKIDNLKSAVLNNKFYEVQYQYEYHRFSKQYGFEITPCKVRAPQEKGKVESGVKYIKSSFLKAREFKNIDEANNRLQEWLNNKANKRVHGTTRKIPLELFKDQEKDLLKALPASKEEFITSSYYKRKVHKKISHVFYEYVYYSVPYKYAGCEVIVYDDSKLLRFVYKGKEIAIHQKESKKGVYVTSKEHCPIDDINNNKKEDLILKKAHEYTQTFLSLVKENSPKSYRKIAKGVESLIKEYGYDIIELCSKRALKYGNISYKEIKNICKNRFYEQEIISANQKPLNNVKNFSFLSNKDQKAKNSENSEHKLFFTQMINKKSALFKKNLFSHNLKNYDLLTGA